MYLSKLEIFGFKSFAQKAVFKFEDGVTAIIGPNGCGKSNIVDAIRWVLGEQRTSVLRLDRMENAIFNGTAVRKPLSLAEVSITIENNKNILPSMYTEVKITRRLYRSGESEYLINNRVARLKDVIDLFADTGMGADAYSVIELKMVEQILSENAEERRRLFEEAAGIKKYKIRRKSALRKLENTDQELVRLNDVIAEVQKTVNSLSRQVGKARRYHQFKNELKEKELFGYQLRMRGYGEQLTPLRQEFAQVRQTRDRLGKEVNQREAELETLQMKSVDLEQKFRGVSARLNEFDEKIRDLQEKVRLNQQRIDSHTQNIERAEQEIESRRRRIAELETELQTLSTAIAETQAEANALHEKYQETANTQLQAETRLDAARQKFQEFRSQNKIDLEKATGKREEYQRIGIQLSGLKDRHARLERQLGALRDELREKEARLAELEHAFREAQNDQEMFTQELAHLRESIARLSGELEPLETARHELLGTIEKRKSRRDFLNKLITGYEGFSESVQYVMSHRGQFGGLVDTLANMVDTSDEYRPALESYLQEVANYLVVDEESTATRILDEIRHQKKGRLTLVPLSLLQASRNGRMDPALLNGETVPLKQVVTFDSRFARLFNFLFDRVLLVKDIESGLRWHRKFPGYNFLTYDGELIGDWGHITGGNSAQPVNLIGRKRQYQRLVAELEAAEKQYRETEEKLADIRQAITFKKAKASEFEKLLSDQQKTVLAAEQQFTRQQYDLERSIERAAEMEAELAQIVSDIGILTGKEEKLLPEVQEADRRQRLFRENEDRLNREVEEAEQQYRQISRQVQDLQMQYLQRQNRMNELNQKQGFDRNNLAEAGKRIEELEAEIARFRAGIDTLTGENEEHNTRLAELYQQRDVVEKEKEEVEKSYQALKSLIMAREEEAKKLHRKLNQAMERIRELELQIREIEVKQKTLREQMDEQYGEELEEFLAAHPLPETLSYPQVQDEIATLRRKIEGLGEVNPLAVKEYDREKERLDFLKEQQADLLKAKGELMETIGKLNKTARSLFMDTFEKINENFHTVFSKFFENGEGRLRLIENQDPLESNIDISVQIKGRQLTSLSVMSAGEKTLTAISLLFSIYLVKPSPFCILDEVDAPLDDVNISRFTNAVKEFADNTQFILVTHNKMTMQAARAMYGITMEEPGVSKVVSVRLD